MQDLFKEKIDSALGSIRFAHKDIEDCLAAASKFEGLDLSDFRYVSVHKRDGNVSATFTLKEECKDSKIYHKFAQHFGMDFQKSKSWSGKELVLSGQIEGLSITIEGVVPPTCELRITEELLSEEEYQKEVARVKRVRVKTEIICTEVQ